MADFVKEYKGVLATFASLLTLFLMFMSFSNTKVDRSEFNEYKDGQTKFELELKEHIKDIKKSQETTEEDIKDILEKL